jgi:hypothetical protein
VVDLPLGYFDGDDSDTKKVEVAVAGQNLVLRRSPLILPAKARGALWDSDRKSWVAEQTDPIQPVQF